MEAATWAAGGPPPPTIENINGGFAACCTAVWICLNPDIFEVQQNRKQNSHQMTRHCEGATAKLSDWRNGTLRPSAPSPSPPFPSLPTMTRRYAHALPHSHRRHSSSRAPPVQRALGFVPGRRQSHEQQVHLRRAAPHARSRITYTDGICLSRGRPR